MTRPFRITVEDKGFNLQQGGREREALTQEAARTTASGKWNGTLACTHAQFEELGKLD